MARGDPTYVKFESSFILHDARLLSMTTAGRWVYASIWAYCGQERKNYLTAEEQRPKYIATALAHCNVNAVRAALQQMKSFSKPLAYLDSSGMLIIRGVREKHPQMGIKKALHAPYWYRDWHEFDFWLFFFFNPFSVFRLLCLERDLCDAYVPASLVPNPL